MHVSNFGWNWKWLDLQTNFVCRSCLLSHVSLIPLTRTSHDFINIFQTKHFSDVKCTKDCEKIWTFLWYQNLQKFGKSWHKNWMGFFDRLFHLEITLPVEDFSWILEGYKFQSSRLAQWTNLCEAGIGRTCLWKSTDIKVSRAMASRLSITSFKCRGMLFVIPIKEALKLGKHFCNCT